MFISNHASESHVDPSFSIFRAEGIIRIIYKLTALSCRNSSTGCAKPRSCYYMNMITHFEVE
jgi:hypothetical protein